MNRFAMISLCGLLAAAAAAGCGDDDDNGGTPDGGGTTADANTTPDARPQLTTAAQILSFLDGKTILMEGDNIPSHPNGFSEDVNFGAATQCYKSVQIATAAQNFTVTSALGTLEGAPSVGDVGNCNRAVQNGTPLSFTSTTVLIENVQGNAECFDLTVTYPAFTQEGRGKISADGQTVTLELFFPGAQGHRCASGAVGSGGISLASGAFTGDAQQVYEVQ